jgi:hypothetical protein
MSPQMMGNTLVMPGGQPSIMGMGEPATGEEGFPMPYTGLKPFNQAMDQLFPGEQGGGDAALQEEAMPGRTVVKSEEVVEALQSATNRNGEPAIDKLKGQVYLVGDIVQRGWTDGKIEFAITERSDQQIIVNALPQWSGQKLLSFTVIQPGKVPADSIPVTATEAPVTTGGSTNVPIAS